MAGTTCTQRVVPEIRATRLKQACRDHAAPPAARNAEKGLSTRRLLGHISKPRTTQDPRSPAVFPRFFRSTVDRMRICYFSVVLLE